MNCSGVEVSAEAFAKRLVSTRSFCHEFGKGLSVISMSSREQTNWPKIIADQHSSGIPPDVVLFFKNEELFQQLV